MLDDFRGALHLLDLRLVDYAIGQLATVSGALVCWIARSEIDTPNEHKLIAM